MRRVYRNAHIVLIATLLLAAVTSQATAVDGALPEIDPQPMAVSAVETR